MYESEYAITYIVVSIFSVAIVMTMSAKMTEDVGKRDEITMFKRLALSVCLISIAEGVRRINLLFPSIQMSNLFLWIVNYLDLVFVVILEYFWYNFLRCIAFKNEMTHKVTDIIAVIVLVADIIFITSSAFTEWVFTIEDGEYIRGDLYLIHATACLVFYVIAFYLLYYTYSVKNIINIREYRRFLILIIIPIIGGIAQVAIGKAPFTVLTVTASLLYYFISKQEDRITTDALTGLLNRGTMDEDLNNMIVTADKEAFILFLTDVNDFKHINDKYGHQVGDKVLVALADAFRTIENQNASFKSYRYGGDEFLFTVDGHFESQANEIINLVNAMFQAKLESFDLDKKPTLGIGYHIVDNKSISLNDVIRSADKHMYEDKYRQRDI